MHIYLSERMGLSLQHCRNNHCSFFPKGEKESVTLGGHREVGRVGAEKMCRSHLPDDSTGDSPLRYLARSVRDRKFNCRDGSHRGVGHAAARNSESFRAPERRTVANEATAVLQPGNELYERVLARR